MDLAFCQRGNEQLRNTRVNTPCTWNRCPAAAVMPQPDWVWELKAGLAWWRHPVRGLLHEPWTQGPSRWPWLSQQRSLGWPQPGRAWSGADTWRARAQWHARWPHQPGRGSWWRHCKHARFFRRLDGVSDYFTIPIGWTYDKLMITADCHQLLYRWNEQPPASFSVGLQTIFCRPDRTPGGTIIPLGAGPGGRTPAMASAVKCLQEVSSCGNEAYNTTQRLALCKVIATNLRMEPERIVLLHTLMRPGKS